MGLGQASATHQKHSYQESAQGDVEWIKTSQFDSKAFEKVTVAKPWAYRMIHTLDYDTLVFTGETQSVVVVK